MSYKTPKLFFPLSCYFVVVLPMWYAGLGEEGGETLKTGGTNKISSVRFLMNVILNMDKQEYVLV